MIKQLKFLWKAIFAKRQAERDVYMCFTYAPEEFWKVLDNLKDS